MKKVIAFLKTYDGRYIVTFLPMALCIVSIVVVLFLPIHSERAGVIVGHLVAGYMISLIWAAIITVIFVPFKMFRS